MRATGVYERASRCPGDMPVAENISYFALLGMSENASQDEVEARYQALTDFLASPTVPEELREWAQHEVGLLEEAYAELLDADKRTSVSATRSPAVPERAEEPLVARPAPSVRAARKKAEPRGWRKAIRHPLFVGPLAGLVVLGAVLIARSGMPGDDKSTSVAASQQDANSVPLDMARINQLMTTVAKDPANLDALFELGESYFLAGQWQPALDWFGKVLAIDTKNVHAMTDVGTARFNLGQTAEAKAAWLQGVELAPDDPQLHYNLGFWYANTEPPDYASARTEWQRVVSLAPDSSLAKTVQVHLSGLPAN